MTNSTENQNESSSNGNVVQAQIVNVGRLPSATEVTITTEMQKAYSYAYTIKWVCCIDMFFCFLYALSNPFWLIFLGCSYAGYYGANHFQVKYIKFYFVYEILTIVSRVVFFSLYVANGGQIQGYGLAMLILSTLIGLWVVELTGKLQGLLYNLTEDQLGIIRNIGYTPRAIVYV
jgi:hypothetical protein